MPATSRHAKFHYLPPSVLDSLKNVEMVARGLVEGSLAGLHRSPYTGFSSEFSEYRKYCPGDAVRFVDWLAYAKTDRYYIKQFHEETNTRAYVLLDVSRSMALGESKPRSETPGMRKFHYACYLAAAFLYLMQRQRDAIGLFTYHEQVADYFPARSSRQHLRALLSHLEGLEPTGRTGSLAAFQRIAREVPRRSLILVFSDFLDPDPTFTKSLEQFRYNGCEVVLFQVLDPQETDFPFRGLIEFRDLETGEVIEVESEDFREAYLGALQGYQRELKLACDRMNIAFEPLSTATPFERALLAYFYKREKLY